jgi:hypothetical protein
MNVNQGPMARKWGLGAAVAAVVAAALVAGCGGGGSASGGTGATAFTAGPIRGFGSIIVNGVRFDDSSAQVENEDGVRGGSDDLKLGSMVEVESEKVDDSTGRAKATRIRFGSEIVGPVQSVDTAANSFVVLGQTVDVKPETVFDDSLGATGVAGLAGKVVEVHAQRDAASGHLVASRIEDKAAATAFKLRGTVSALEPNAKTFQIGTAVINYGGIAPADLPANLANGMKVRVKLQTAQVGGQWVATAVRSGERKVEDHDDARLIGNVSAFTSATAFEVGGVAVDAGSARIDNGPVTADSRVEVRGAAKDGKIVATRVKVLDGTDDMLRGVELHGPISDVSTSAKTFMLRGVKVSFGGSVVYERGTEALLVAGAKVEAKGALSSDGTTLNAVLIRFED